ncbi:MAG: hypothetical protein EBQ88_02355 [Betaproteobacteria bacterium]|nr:hypothetical protein [Betaproteobacteria bacterium]
MGKGVEQGLRVSWARFNLVRSRTNMAKTMTLSDQLLSPRPVVVNFTIEYQHPVATGFHHGLRRAIPCVAYGQTTVGQGQPQWLIDPKPTAIWATMLHGLCHRARPLRHLVNAGRRTHPNSGNGTHAQASRPLTL